ncbi:MAG TPA: anaerobic sulfatase maturase [Symbiobacteriaceae bacterium]|nr:anaerobic sulfatase maturase [Symbiobacteriaceae bacterium]
MGFTFLVKPASGDCNMRCRYCFYFDTHSAPGARMSLRTLERLISEACACPTKFLSFGWQGGEPTLAGLDFFREAVRLQQQHRRPGQKIANALQTNGLLLDDEWCRFLKEQNFLVGLSIDGEQARHDGARPDAGGHGTYDRAVRAFEMLKSHGVETNLLAVVTPDVARRGRQAYRSLKALGAEYLQFIPSLDGGSYALRPDEYGTFLKQVFDEWRADHEAGRHIGVQFFESVAAMATGRPPVTCQYAGTCEGQVVVEYNGSLYPCDFMVTPERRLGSICDSPLIDVLQGERMKEYLTWAVRLPDYCRDCQFLHLCRGGCPHQRSMRGGDPSRPDYFCKSYQTFFRHAVPDLVRLATARRPLA